MTTKEKRQYELQAEAPGASSVSFHVPDSLKDVFNDKKVEARLKWINEHIDMSLVVSSPSPYSGSEKYSSILVKALFVMILIANFDFEKPDKWTLRIRIGANGGLNEFTLGSTAVRNHTCLILLRNLPLWKTIKTLGHEIAHFAQYQRGELERAGEFSVYKGERFSRKTLPRTDWPWEKDAEDDEAAIFSCVESILEQDLLRLDRDFPLRFSDFVGQTTVDQVIKTVGIMGLITIVGLIGMAFTAWLTGLTLLEYMSNAILYASPFGSVTIVLIVLLIKYRKPLDLAGRFGYWKLNKMISDYFSRQKTKEEHHGKS